MQAAWCEKTGSNQWRCRLCPHACVLTDGKDGICGVRGVRKGQALALGYGQISALQVDPIEKKPLYHFYPGSNILSVGGWGCNFRCRFCQNWRIARGPAPASKGQLWQPEDVVHAAQESGGIGVAYTYNEPLVGYEFVRATCQAVQAAGLRNVLVTNGFVNPDPALALFPFVDAVNTDIKSLQPSFYRQYCGGELAPVLDFARRVADAGIHQEITTLLIPGLNDNENDVAALIDWIAGNLGTDTVLHLTGYHPACDLKAPPTTAQGLLHAWELACRHLQHVYIGNVAVSQGTHTACPACGACLVRRQRMCAERVGLSDQGHCTRCGAVSGIRL